MNRLEYLRQIKTMLPPNPVCAEIGVYRGDFAKMILDELKPNILLLVDTWGMTIPTNEQYKDGLKVMYSTDHDYAITIKKLENYNSVVFEYSTSVEAAKNYSDYHLDFIYIDADHRYESVKKDLEMWYELLTPNGIIAGHDYGNLVFTGVKKAVDEFCEERNLKVALLSDEGDFILIKDYDVMRIDLGESLIIEGHPIAINKK